MKDNPFDMMIAGADHTDVLDVLRRLSRSELNTLAAAIREEQISDIAIYVDARCQSIGLQKTLLCGGLLECFSRVVDRDDRRELYDSLIEDLGMSRTQAARCRSAWRWCGAPLMTNPALGRCFAVESLKILGEERTPQAARDEALRLAEAGEKVSIKKARSLQRKHGVVSKPKKAGSTTARSDSAKKSRSSMWQFVGNVVRVVLEPNGPPEAAKLSSVIRDLESLIAMLRKKLNDSSVPPTTAV